MIFYIHIKKHYSNLIISYLKQYKHTSKKKNIIKQHIITFKRTENNFDSPPTPSDIRAAKKTPQTPRTKETSRANQIIVRSTSNFTFDVGRSSKPIDMSFNNHFRSFKMARSHGILTETSIIAQLFSIATLVVIGGGLGVNFAIMR